MHGEKDKQANKKQALPTNARASGCSFSPPEGLIHHPVPLALSMRVARHGTEEGRMRKAAARAGSAGRQDFHLLPSAHVSTEPWGPRLP